MLQVQGAAVLSGTASRMEQEADTVSMHQAPAQAGASAPWLLAIAGAVLEAQVLSGAHQEAVRGHTREACRVIAELRTRPRIAVAAVLVTAAEAELLSILVV